MDDTVIRINGLSKSFAAVAAVQGVSFTLRRGTT
jgi:ABC-type sugar transport system ATPase subunit